MAHKFKRRSGADKTGRSKFPEPFVLLRRYLLDSEAYRSLKPIPRAAYTELRRRYNGSNNGEISCSIREMADRINCSKDSASDAFDELLAKGFIKQARPASFHFKVRHAPTWILTEENYADQLPTKEFMRWSVSKEKAGPESRTAGPEQRTVSEKKDRSNGQAVLKTGPNGHYERGSRS
jgi:hypothetical protein